MCICALLMNCVEDKLLGLLMLEKYLFKFWKGDKRNGNKEDLLFREQILQAREQLPNALQSLFDYLRFDSL